MADKWGVLSVIGGKVIDNWDLAIEYRWLLGFMLGRLGLSLGNLDSTGDWSCAALPIHQRPTLEPRAADHQLRPAIVNSFIVKVVNN